MGYDIVWINGLRKHELSDCWSSHMMGGGWGYCGPTCYFTWCWSSLPFLVQMPTPLEGSNSSVGSQRSPYIQQYSTALRPRFAAENNNNWKCGVLGTTDPEKMARVGGSTLLKEIGS